MNNKRYRNLRRTITKYRKNGYSFIFLKASIRLKTFLIIIGKWDRKTKAGLFVHFHSIIKEGKGYVLVMMVSDNHEDIVLLAPKPEILVRRYKILRKIYYSSPLGRRSLAAYFQVGERVLRREIETLREQGLISVSSKGMFLTASGKSLVASITPFLKSFLGLTVLEEKLLKLLKVKRVIVVPGDLEQDEVVLLEMGRAAARDPPGMSGSAWLLYPADVLRSCC